MNAIERQHQKYQKLEERHYRLIRQKKRQRRILFFLAMLFLLFVFLWIVVNNIPRYTWLKPSEGFYRPEELITRQSVSPDYFGMKPLPLTHEDSMLKQKLIQEFSAYPSETFKPHLFYVNLQDYGYVNIGGDDPVPAASVIKLPILLEYFRQVDRGNITPYTPLIYEDFEQASGSGNLQYQALKQSLLAKDVARIMIQESDNSCTNMLIYRLGGADGLNRLFNNMGLKGTYINNWLPDLRGTNVISMRDMATVLFNIAQGGSILSEESKQAAFEILKGTRNRHLLPELLPGETTVVAHKTGDIGTSLGDSGIIQLSDGRSYIVAIQVERPFNDYRAKEMIQKTSRVIYDTLNPSLQ